MKFAVTTERESYFSISYTIHSHKVGPMFKNKLYAFMLVACSVLALNTASADEEKILNIYNWSDYIDPTIIPDFEKETGIRVVYDVFDSNEVLEAKLLSGKTGYDIVVPSSDFLSRQIQAGVFRKLNKANIPNLKNLDPAQMTMLSKIDPNNDYAIPYEQGTTGIAYNLDQVAKRMGVDYKVDSWDLVFKPELLAKFNDCGVAVLNAPTEVIATAMHYLGLPTQPVNPKAYAPAEELLLKMRDNVTYFHSSQSINDLANGDICIAVAWSGDMLQAASRAKEAQNGVNINYIVPKEGALVFYDMIAIPADADHPENAEKFINFLLRPENIAKVSSYTSYANSVPASKEFVISSVRDNENIFLTAEMMSKCFMNGPLPNKVNKAINKLWAKVKTGE